MLFHKLTVNPNLPSNETVVLSVGANHVGKRANGTPNAIGGRIYLTDKQLYFTPHNYEIHHDGQKQWSVSISEIRRVSIAPREFGWSAYLTGALRRRLEITLNNGDRHYFVVNKVADLAKRIAAHLG